jgi:L-lactate dehydrogenase (cytochrome)
VLIGRPWVWAIAGSGEAGLVDLLATFKRELAVAMALTGARSISEVHRGLIEWDRC